ncbi:MAG: glycerophosphodiester phosphodiesterase family protein [Bacteroidetes bacterium]|nr:glycerophosphodiester phosphodiesterase family protein [Bacteroidota bacterium]
MRRLLFYLIFIALLIAGCNKTKEGIIPSVGPNSILNETYPLADDSRKVMDGIYTVTAGVDPFGDEVVIKWSRKKMSVFCSDGHYFVFDAGQLDSVVMIQGYWRYCYNDDTGLASAYIARDEGGRDILKANPHPERIVIRGGFGKTGSEISEPLEFVYLRPISPAVLSKHFSILAHRSGGRTSDNLPVSENSIAMINFTEGLGSTGIEIDVQLTRDGIPVLYHDADINIRLTQKGPLSGPIKDFTYIQLFYLVRLIHGEHLPTLKDALMFVVDSTLLTDVYIDMKEKIPTMSAVIPIQREMLQRAKDKGRELNIYIGLPSEDAISDFMNQPGYLDIPSLCELGTDDVAMVNSIVWAPRWTQGTQNEQVSLMHSQRRLAWTWTLDNVNWILEFINNGQFDGILTNYPFVVGYYHYIREN